MPKLKERKCKLCGADEAYGTLWAGLKREYYHKDREACTNYLNNMIKELTSVTPLSMDDIAKWCRDYTNHQIGILQAQGWEIAKLDTRQLDVVEDEIRWAMQQVFKSAQVQGAL
jgi:hypothetical protein